MSQGLSLRRVCGFLIVLAILLGGFGWLQRERLRAWYYVRGLALAGEGDRDAWLGCVLRLDRAAVPRLVGCLRQTGARPCANAELGLARLLKRWGPDDERSPELVEQLAVAFAGLSPRGQMCSLRLGRLLGQLIARTTAGERLDHATAELLVQATAISDAAVRAEALALAQSPLGQSQSTAMIHAGRELVRACLHDDSVANRSRALRLALRPDIDLRAELVALLRDPSAEMRRSALLEIGPMADLLPTDDLLRWLHDPDADVRRLCESALRGRGLRDNHIRLGRLMTDERPTVRLQVLKHLQRETDLEPGVWLRRLSHDAAPAVRAATLRASAAQSTADLTDRIDQMAQNDPSPTVRQLARFYLSCRKSE
jgi:hypothetical protein